MNDPHLAITLLNRLAERRPEQAVRLEEALRGRLDELAEVCLDVAVETGDPVGQVLAGALRAGVEVSLLERLGERLRLPRYRHAVPLLEVSAAVWQGLLETGRQPGSAPSGRERVESAWLAHSLSHSLMDLGRGYEALAWGRKAAVGLSAAASAGTRFDLSPADGLQAVGTALARTGAADEALETFLEAVEARRRRLRDGSAVRKEDLATALLNLGAQLGELGRHSEALAAESEAVAILRELEEEAPGSRLEGLATALNNLATTFGDLGDWDRFLDLAQEAVDRFQELAHEAPQTFGARAAAVRSNLAVALASHGRPREALDHQRRVVQTLRALERSRPEAFREELAGGLRNLGFLLDASGSPDEGLDVLAEAQELYERMQGLSHEVVAVDLGMTLSTSARILASLDRFAEAAERSERAVALLREVAARHQEQGLPGLVACLQVRFRVLRGMGRNAEALEVGHDLERTARQATRLNVDHYRFGLAEILYELGESHAEQHRHREAVRLLEESAALKTEVLRQLRERDAHRSARGS